MTDIIITGAGGYIGSSLVPTLLDAGHRITAVDRFFFHRLADRPRLNCVTADTRRLDARVFRGHAVFIDLAALSSEQAVALFPAAARAINRDARVRNAMLAREAGIRHHLLISSCSVYGETNLSDYSTLNLETEQQCRQLQSSTFRVSCLRLATLFGVSPRQRLDLCVNAMAYDAILHGVVSVFGDGLQRRPFVHVRDVCRVIAALAMRAPDPADRGPLNVGSEGMTFRINDVAERVARIASGYRGGPVSVCHRQGGAQSSYGADFADVQSLLPAAARFLDLEDGIVELCDGIRDGTVVKAPRTNTAHWYETLERSGEQVAPELALHGGFLTLDRQDLLDIA